MNYWLYIYFTERQYVPQEFPEEEEMEELTEEKVDSDEEVMTKKEVPLINTSKPLSTSEIFIARHEELQHKKFKIGVLCSGILENPENKVQYRHLYTNIAKVF